MAKVKVEFPRYETAEFAATREHESIGQYVRDDVLRHGYYVLIRRGIEIRKGPPKERGGAFFFGFSVSWKFQ